MKIIIVSGLLFFLFALTLVASRLSADQPPLQGGQYAIIRSTIDSGGGNADGGIFKLRATIGQHDADHQKTGGEFELRSGFWTEPAEVSEAIFSDSFE